MPPKKRIANRDTDPQKKKRRKRKNGNGDGLDDSSKVPRFLLEDNEVDDSAVDITLEGSLSNGELLICGGTNWDLIGRSSVPKGTKNAGGPNLWGPNRMGGMDGIRVRTVVSGCTACHSVLIATNGKVYTWGRNEKGQLGHGDTQRRDLPTLVECLQNFNIIDAACGKNHTLFLTDKGRVLSCGDNKMGQLGLGLQSPFVPSPTRINYKGPPIRKVSCGGEFCMIADIRGNLYSFGCPEYGQLGHNTDGKFFVTSNKLSFKCETSPRKVNVFIEKAKEGYVIPIPEVDVRDVACGINHTVIVDSQKRAFSWGFGGYGRLGHYEQKDELVPRQLKFFDSPSRGATQVFAGSTFSLGISETGGLYFWGQTKSSGEASMYPKQVMDLNGWRIRSVGCCNKSIVVVADESVITWGPSPTYGELGYGATKPHSSTRPMEVKSLDGVYVHSAGCGYAHTLLIARADTEADRQKLDKLPVFTP